MVFKPEINDNNTLQFPVYLVEGDNGQLGIDVFNYITNLMFEDGTTCILVLGEVYIYNWLIRECQSPAPMENIKSTYVMSYGQACNDSPYDILLYPNGYVELLPAGGN